MPRTALPPVSPLLDEDARLCSLSVFDAFRLLQNLLNIPKEEREAMFFGGLFSYDLVAGLKIYRNWQRKITALISVFISLKR